MTLLIIHGDSKTVPVSYGIVRRVDDFGRIVIPKEIRRTLRIREGDPSCTTFTSEEQFKRAVTNIYI